MLAGDLGHFVASTRYSDLPRTVVEIVKLRVLDTFGAALAGFRLGRYENLLPLLGGQGDASAWGLGRKLALRDATLFNSFLSHCVYLDDGSRFTGGHPSSVSIPSAFALAEAKGASGKELIAAIAVGYEVFLRLGRAIYPSTLHRGFQSTSVLGAIASAAACASMLGLDIPKATHALAIGAFMGVGLIEASTSSGSQPLQVARSCEGGVVAALFAEQGARGAEAILERGFLTAFSDGAAMDGILVGLGSDFRIFETYTKIHGGCRGNHAPVDVVQQLMNKHAIAPKDIAGILVRVDSVTDRIAIHEPANSEQAQYSVPFAVAAAVIFGDASIYRYSEAALADPIMRAMMSKVRVEVDIALDRGYPDRRPAYARILLADGTCYEGYMENAKGEPEYPFSPSEIEHKFMTLSRDVLPEGGKPVSELVAKLDALASVRDLADALGAGKRS